MAPPQYAARVSRLVGPGKTMLFEVEIQPPNRPPGQVSEERVRVVIREDPDAPLERVAAKARYVLASVGQAEWSIEDAG